MHALAKFAQRVGILSEKLHAIRFSQVPAGSDCPYFRPILPKLAPNSDFITVPFLFHGNGLRQVPRLIRIEALQQANLIGKEL